MIITALFVSQAYLLISATSSQVQNTRINPVDGAEMVRLPAGSFVMGSSTADIDDMWAKLSWNSAWKEHTKSEQPAHQVRIDGFWIYKDNVTVAQYRKFCRATKRTMPNPPEWGWKENHPMVHVTWADAKGYCDWAKARLPYEAEWEYAARGGNTGLKGRARTVFSWGDQYPQGRKVANVADTSYKTARYYNSNFRLFGNYSDGFTHTSPVDAFPANGYGLRDMTGNVWQWCEDWFAADYYQHSPTSNPRGPERGERRVIRGGAFDTPPEMTRLARRVSSLPTARDDEKGFRCVQDR